MNTTDSPEITPFLYGQFTHDKGDQKCTMGKRSVSSANDMERGQPPTNNEIALLPYSMPKKDSKEIKDLHVRLDASGSIVANEVYPRLNSC